jgi:hypothetical protein
MTKIVSYQWMIKQINKLEDAIIKECGFCLGDDKTPTIPTEFNKNSKVATNVTKNIEKRVTNIRRLEEFINHYEFITMEMILIESKKGKSGAEWKNLLNRLEQSRKIVDKESDVIQYEIDFSTHKSIDTLSKISFIFLPLSFIVGYFGMNFTTMGMVGHNMDRKGILMWKHGHFFIKISLLISFILSVGYLYFLERRDTGPKRSKGEIDKLTDIQSTARDFD